MKFRLNALIPAIVISAVCVLSFLPVFTKGFVPYPGDLLLAEYQPWRSYGFSGITAGAIPHKAQYFDTLRQMYPWRTLTNSQYSRMLLPLWNPYNFSGAPLAANSQSQAYFPLTVLYGILPANAAWTALVLLQVLLSLVVTYSYVRMLGVSRAGSLLSAVSYSLSLYMTVFLEYNIMGHFMYILPMLLSGVEYVFRGRRKLGFILVSAGVFLAATAGHLQLSGGVILTALFYAVVRNREKSGSLPLIPIISGLLLGLGLAAIQIIPTAELLLFSARSPLPYGFFTDNLLLKWHQLILALSPDFYGNPAVRSYLLPFSYPSKALYFGILPLVLALFSVSYGMPPAARRFLRLGILITVLLTDNPATRILYALKLPLLSSSSPSNFQFLAVFCFAVLAGFGTDRLSTIRRLPHLQFAVSAGILISAVSIHALFHIPFNQKQAALGMILIACSWIAVTVLSHLRQRLALKLLVISFTALELIYFFMKFNSFVPPSWVHPDTEIGSWLKTNTPPDRVWGYGNAGIESNFATGIGFLSPDGYDPMYPVWYGQFLQASKDGRVPAAFDRTNRSDATITPGYGETDLTENGFRLKALSALGVRYILDKKENGSTGRTFPAELFSERVKLGDWTVFEYKNALPRAYLVQNAGTYDDPDGFARTFFDPSFNPSQTVLLERIPEGFTGSQYASSSATIVSYTPLNISVETDTPRDSILVLSDTFYPGWNAAVDGAETKILRANLAFRAVRVPAGVHTVTFAYQPAWLGYAFWITLVSAVLLLIMLFKIV